MTLKEYINNLQDLLNKRPELKDLPVIYSRDDEGNGYHTIKYEPAICNADLSKSWIENVYFEESMQEEDLTANSVCVN